MSDVAAALPLIEEGLREARAIGHPIARGRHRAAWLLRLSAVDPERAAELAAEALESPDDRARLLITVLEDRLRRGDTDLEPHFSRAVQAMEGAEPESRLHLLNELSEAAIELSGREPETARALLRRLLETVRAREAELAGTPSLALAWALLGEALFLLDDPEGAPLLAEAERLAAELPIRDAVLAFIAGAVAERDPQRAAALADRLEDTATRSELRAQIAGKCADPELRARLLDAAAADALRLEPIRVPEALARVAQAAAQAGDAERARELFLRAARSAEGSAPQVRGLQWAGVATAMARLDPDAAREWFRRAVQAVEEEAGERRVSALILIAEEMATTYPEEAAAVFRRAMEEATSLEAMWELAHVVDLVFREDRPPPFDLTVVRPVLEKALGRLCDDDPRIPGVFGLPEAARAMLRVDRERGAEVLRRWFAAAERAGDTQQMAAAAVLLSRADPAGGRSALERTRDELLRRIDCPAMGEFSRTAAPVAPHLVLELAPHIPDRRERADAITAAALALYRDDPNAALAHIRSLERPMDRSSALLALVDRLLGTGDRPLPQPLLEDLP